MKILIALSSPRKHGYSTYLAETAGEYLKSRGMEIEFLNLYKMDIKACTACDRCRKKSGEFCVLDDDMKPVYKKISESAGLILACPIYWFTINAKMKLFIDRFYGFHTEKTEILKGKNIGIILAYGDVDPYISGAVNAIRTLEDSFKYTKSHISGIVYGTGTEKGERSPDGQMENKVRNLAEEMIRKINE